MSINVSVDTDKVVLSSLRSVYKTESFVYATRKIAFVDVLLARVAEGIFSASVNFGKGRRSYLCETEDRFFTLFFVTGEKGKNTEENDLIFYKFLSLSKTERKNDRQIAHYLERNKTFSVVLREITENVGEDDLAKLYLLSESDKVQFPHLTGVQRSIVETENANVLVQGVAGSGKTNVCIEKILYCACRNYRGRVLYSTFSRGLLAETKNRVTVMRENIERFVLQYEAGKVVFLDKNHKKAVENKFGIPFSFEEDEYLIDVLKRVTAFLRDNVDYFLVEDLYESVLHVKPNVFREGDFSSVYLPDARKRLAGVLDKAKNLSSEIVYKEIYGMIFGRYEPESPSPLLTRDEYAAERRSSFSRSECDAVYTVALDYKKFCERTGQKDNNLLSRELLEAVSAPLYSVVVLDEVQDFTQVNLALFKKIARKTFAVGDALQMINPSYFSFGYLKRLLYGDVTGVTELKHNYRSTENIQRIVNALGDMNVRKFGTHSFVLKGESVKSDAPTRAIYVTGKDFLPSIGENRYADVTVIVSSKERKERMRKILPKTEVLTVAEAKGLERTTVVLADVLTDNADKWHALTAMTLDRKTADENSVYRYYFNLFYVGVSRAKQYLLAYEENAPASFDGFFASCFEQTDKEEALSFLAQTAGRIELDDEELVERIREFCALEQYENAYFTADRLSDDVLREQEIGRIYVNEKYLKEGNYREAGVEFWRRGMDDDAKKMFRVSGDEQLIPLIDACRGEGKNLDVGIVRFLPLLQDNAVAKQIVTETIKNDYTMLMGIQKEINATLKAKRSKR